ncbi:aldehyde dehydrogenase family protein [Virgibacillus oceani]
MREQYKERTLGYIEKGVKEGAKLIRDGREDGNVQEKGYFVGVTIFDNVTTEMKIWQDEIFAPVLSIVSVKDLSEAIDVTIQSPLAMDLAYLRGMEEVQQFRENIDAGMLGINIVVPAPMAFFPFSGWKNSFYGDLDANGKDGVEFYTRKKVVTTR